jgi:isoleucyl-tRNA synthetase
MTAVRLVITEGLALRAKNNIKVRQPLAKVEVLPEQLDLLQDFSDIVKEELNVKEVLSGPTFTIDTHITAELKAEGLMREVIRQVQNARKLAGLEVDDRIILELSTDDAELEGAVNAHNETILSETLVTTQSKVTDGFESVVQIEGRDLKIRLKKAS